MQCERAPEGGPQQSAAVLICRLLLKAGGSGHGGQMKEGVGIDVERGIGGQRVLIKLYVTPVDTLGMPPGRHERVGFEAAGREGFIKTLFYTKL